MSRGKLQRRLCCYFCQYPFTRPAFLLRRGARDKAHSHQVKRPFDHNTPYPTSPVVVVNVLHEAVKVGDISPSPFGHLPGVACYSTSQDGARRGIAMQRERRILVGVWPLLMRTTLGQTRSRVCTRSCMLASHLPRRAHGSSSPIIMLNKQGGGYVIVTVVIVAGTPMCGRTQTWWAAGHLGSASRDLAVDSSPTFVES